MAFCYNELSEKKVRCKPASYGEKMIYSLITKSVYSGFFLDSLGLGYQFFTLLLAVVQPLICAAAVFICLRRAVLKSKMLSFVINCIVYELITLPLFLNIQKSSDFFFGAGYVKIPDICGYLCALMTGTVLLGFTVLICSNGIMKFRGRLSVCCLTALFGAWQGFAAYKCEAISLRGYSGFALFEVLPFTGFLPDIISESGTDTVCTVVFGVYTVCIFMCFLANRNPKEVAEFEKKLREEASIRRHGLTEDAAAELCCCANCQYASVLLSDPDSVLCDEKGIVGSTHICRNFIYDPLKRVPPRGESPYAQTVNSYELPHPDKGLPGSSPESDSLEDASVVTDDRTNSNS